jgi:hypothetical protein
MDTGLFNKLPVDIIKTFLLSNNKVLPIKNSDIYTMGYALLKTAMSNTKCKLPVEIDDCVTISRLTEKQRKCIPTHNSSDILTENYNVETLNRLFKVVNYDLSPFKDRTRTMRILSHINRLNADMSVFDLCRVNNDKTINRSICIYNKYQCIFDLLDVGLFDLSLVSKDLNTLKNKFKMQVVTKLKYQLKINYPLSILDNISRVKTNFISYDPVNGRYLASTLKDIRYRQNLRSPLCIFPIPNIIQIVRYAFAGYNMKYEGFVLLDSKLDVYEFNNDDDMYMPNTPVKNHHISKITQLISLGNRYGALSKNDNILYSVPLPKGISGRNSQPTLTDLKINNIRQLLNFNDFYIVLTWFGDLYIKKNSGNYKSRLLGSKITYMASVSSINGIIFLNQSNELYIISDIESNYDVWNIKHNLSHKIKQIYYQGAFDITYCITENGLFYSGLITDNNNLIKFDQMLGINDVVDFDPLSKVITTKNLSFYYINSSNILNITDNGDLFKFRSHHNNKERMNIDRDNDIIKFNY